MSMGEEDNRLATLTRDILGAKGLLEIAKGLLDSLTPERRAQLTEQIILESSAYEIRAKISDMLIRELTAETKAKVKTALEAKIQEDMPELVKKVAGDVQRAIETAARDQLRRW